MISIRQGDITNLGFPVAAIVNAANQGLRPGGGVCGSIYHVAGVNLHHHMQAKGPIGVSEVSVSPAFDLEADYIIHAVGPIYEKHRAAECERLLFQTYVNILDAARRYDIHSIALPAISTGIYGFPARKASIIAYTALRCFGRQDDVIYVVAFDDETYRLYHEQQDAWSIK